MLVVGSSGVGGTALLLRQWRHLMVLTCDWNEHNLHMWMLMRVLGSRSSSLQRLAFTLSAAQKTELLPRPFTPCHNRYPRLHQFSSASIVRATMATQSDTTKPTVTAEAAELFQRIEETFATTKLGDDRWYILTLAALVGGTEPEIADQLYLYIINKAHFRSPSARQALVRRLREVLVKLTSIVGVCKPLEAIIAIMKVENEEDRDYSFSRENWKNDQENHDKGMDWMRQIYAHNIEPTLDLFKAHQDFRWISTEITYGLYLSDRQNLDDLDTELVVLVGIMIQNLRLETHWHIRGTRRIGVSKEDTESIVECVREVAKFMGTSLSKIPTVEEVEKDV
jgi:hypothetical protein